MDYTGTGGASRPNILIVRSNHLNRITLLRRQTDGKSPHDKSGEPTTAWGSTGRGRENRRWCMSFRQRRSSEGSNTPAGIQTPSNGYQIGQRSRRELSTAENLQGRVCHQCGECSQHATLDGHSHKFFTGKMKTPNVIFQHNIRRPAHGSHHEESRPNRFRPCGEITHEPVNTYADQRQKPVNERL